VKYWFASCVFALVLVVVVVLTASADVGFKLPIRDAPVCMDVNEDGHINIRACDDALDEFIQGLELCLCNPGKVYCFEDARYSVKCCKPEVAK